MDSPYTEYNYYPDIAADIELASSSSTNVETSFNSYSNFGSYLRTLESLEEANNNAKNNIDKYSTSTDNMPNFSHKLPELDKDSITEALNEIENLTSMQSTSETELMDIDRLDNEEDFLTPVTSPNLHNILSCDKLDNDNSDTSVWEEIFSKQNRLIEEFVEIVDVSTISRNTLKNFDKYRVTNLIYLFPLLEPGE